jgi:5-oxoprolinase (ATP-hydrolysing)
MQVIGFDMGGTSTDVSRYDGTFEHVLESTTAGVTIQAPQLDINTVAAGGGSRLFFRSGVFAVGPDSAGAHPGPVCYRKGGHLAVTDANAVLGRVIPKYFPQIFGPNENEPLDREGTSLNFQGMPNYDGSMSWDVVQWLN